MPVAEPQPEPVPDADWCGQCDRPVDSFGPPWALTGGVVDSVDRFCSALCVIHYLVDHLGELEP